MSLDDIHTTQLLLGIAEFCAIAVLAAILARHSRRLREIKDLAADNGREQRALLEAFSRPVLRVSMNLLDAAGACPPSLRLEVENCGNGPARVRSAHLLVDGRMLALERAGDHEKAALRLLEKQFTRSVGGFLASGDYWIGSGKSAAAFSMELDASIKPTTMDAMRRRINFKVDYGSITERAPAQTAWLRPPS
ncbi:MAG: hypothetical protein ACRD3Q_16265 [Terriglobales bacterium]